MIIQSYSTMGGAGRRSRGMIVLLRKPNGINKNNAIVPKKGRTHRTRFLNIAMILGPAGFIPGYILIYIYILQQEYIILYTWIYTLQLPPGVAEYSLILQQEYIILYTWIYTLQLPPGVAEYSLILLQEYQWEILDNT